MQSPASRPTLLAIHDLCLRQFLLLLHPIAPFITEELYHSLGYCPASAFIQNIRPESGNALRATLATQGLQLDPDAIAQTALLREFTTQARALKAQQNQAARKDARLHLIAKDTAACALVEANEGKLKKLIGAAIIQLHPPGTDTTNPPFNANPATPTPTGILFLDITGNVDIAAEKIRLTRELERLEKLVTAGQTKLSNEAFVSKAPPQILEGARQQLAETQARYGEIQRLLQALFK